MSTRISRLTEFDPDLLRYLFEKAGVAHPAPNPEFFQDDKNIMLIARTDEAVSGFIWGYVLSSPDRSTPKMFLYSVDVFEPFRRRGIGTDLIQALKKYALERNCYKMFVPTHRNNIPAQALYRKTGGVVLAPGEEVSFDYDLKALHE